MKLCIDCKWYQAPLGNAFVGIYREAKCKREEVISPVDGSYVDNCRDIRADEVQCGPKGVWFEEA